MKFNILILMEFTTLFVTFIQREFFQSTTLILCWYSLRYISDVIYLYSTTIPHLGRIVTNIQIQKSTIKEVFITVKHLLYDTRFGTVSMTSRPCPSSVIPRTRTLCVVHSPLILPPPPFSRYQRIWANALTNHAPSPSNYTMCNETWTTVCVVIHVIWWKWYQLIIT